MEEVTTANAGIAFVLWKEPLVAFITSILILDIENGLVDIFYFSIISHYFAFKCTFQDSVEEPDRRLLLFN